MAQAVKEFQQRMRSDRAFRQHILSARKSGTLAEILEREGYAFDLSELHTQLPQVQTGIHAGADRHQTESCYCMI